MPRFPVKIEHLAQNWIVQTQFHTLSHSNTKVSGSITTFGSFKFEQKNSP